MILSLFGQLSINNEANRVFVMTALNKKFYGKLPQPRWLIVIVAYRYLSERIREVSLTITFCHRSRSDGYVDMQYVRSDPISFSRSPIMTIGRFREPVTVQIIQ